MLRERQVGADVRDRHGNTVLMVAAQNNRKRIIKTSLRRGGDINAQNGAGQTALHFCFAYGYVDLAEYLIGKGADDRLRNAAGLLPHEGLTAARAARAVHADVDAASDVTSLSGSEFSDYGSEEGGAQTGRSLASLSSAGSEYSEAYY